MNNIPAIANDSTLGGDGRLEDVVRLPDGVDLNEWLSTNLMDSYRQLKMLYGIVCGACTPETCPLMTVGPKHEYSWTDGDQIVPTTATLYIGYVMTWINDMFDDDSTFPTQVGMNLQHCLNQKERIFRERFSEKFQEDLRDDISSNDSSLWPHLPVAFRKCEGAERDSSPEHFIQAVLPLHQTILIDY
ncbi:hypothetical protein WR25_06772 isoform B [Diploscapter pachys]|uniref:Mob1/phocein family protein n=1 Tax=Diploscapter pachys TaxID=2018661 RepID=A0A2A2J4A3_9BILA|nr:hypothetical protein WR25_06772 isoform B [Diploscapter pachys]